MAMIPGEKREFGACDVEMEDRKVEPRPERRGDIARTYMYMDWAYPGRGIISGKNRKLFEAWHKQDPADAWERERAKRVERIQGNRNPFIWGEQSVGGTKATDATTAPSGTIIGNRRSKLYHLSDCPGYAKVSQKNRVSFASEANAYAARYRRAGNCQ